MKHYINTTTNTIYAYESDGSQDQYIDPSLVPLSEEEVLAHIEALKENISPNDKIKNQILDLEKLITPRRLREAVLTDQGKSWLETVNGQIAVLRSRLV